MTNFLETFVIGLAALILIFFAAFGIISAAEAWHKEDCSKLKQFKAQGYEVVVPAECF